METPVLLRRIFVLFAVLTLAACGGAPTTDQAIVPPTSAQPTAAPPSRETFAPSPTQLPAPTVAAATQPPMQPPESTALSPTQPPAPATLAPTQPPAPTSAPATQSPASAATALPAASFGSEI